MEGRWAELGGGGHQGGEWSSWQVLSPWQEQGTRAPAPQGPGQPVEQEGKGRCRDQGNLYP